MTTSPTRAMAGPVTFEHHREALGIGEARPRLSWTTATSPVNSADPEWVQGAYEVRLTGADGFSVTSGRIDGAGLGAGAVAG